MQGRTGTVSSVACPPSWGGAPPILPLAARRAPASACGVNHTCQPVQWAQSSPGPGCMPTLNVVAVAKNRVTPATAMDAAAGVPGGVTDLEDESRALGRARADPRCRQLGR